MLISRPVETNMNVIEHKKYWTVALAFLAGAFCLLPGCEPKFDMSRGTMLGDNISPQNTWKISSTGGGFIGLRQAIDGSAITFAITSKRYNNATITLDLGRPCIFNLVALRHGMNENAFARRVSLSTSLDGKKYTSRYECIGTKRITYIPILTPITARYIKIRATVPGRESWSIAEIYLQ